MNNIQVSLWVTFCKQVNCHFCFVTSKTSLRISAISGKVVLRKLIISHWWFKTLKEKDQPHNFVHVYLIKQKQFSATLVWEPTEFTKMAW